MFWCIIWKLVLNCWVTAGGRAPPPILSWCSGLCAAFFSRCRSRVANILCCFRLSVIFWSTHTSLFSARTHWKNIHRFIVEDIMENTPFYRLPWIIFGSQEDDCGRVHCELVTPQRKVWAEWEAKYWTLLIVLSQLVVFVHFVHKHSFAFCHVLWVRWDVRWLYSHICSVKIKM